MTQLAPGDSIGSYRVVSLVAGRPDVYRAVHHRAPQRAIVKVAPSSDWRAMAVDMLRAASVLESLHHAGIQRVIDLGVLADRRPWIASELVEGIALSDLIQRRKLSPVEVASIVRDVSEVLAHAHEHGVLHRHLTPVSITLRTGERTFPVSIGDWGDVRFSHGVEPTVYEAPEREPSGKRDVYALGVIAFRALTGMFPIGATHDVPGATGPLAELIIRMLGTDAAHRPTATQVWAMAAKLAGERAILAQGTPSGGLPVVRENEMAAVAERMIAQVEAITDEDGEIVLEDADLEPMPLPKHAQPPPLPPLRKPRWTPPFSMSQELADAQALALRISGKTDTKN